MVSLFWRVALLFLPFTSINRMVPGLFVNWKFHDLRARCTLLENAGKGNAGSTVLSLVYLLSQVPLSNSERISKHWNSPILMELLIQEFLLAIRANQGTSDLV